ncbi:hypothetical protein BDZ94DRAFT_1243233 [Collybia nuda]|uniref:Uncharacterized protein n=1 Tax=Collybia nuda TaxID=64659 RepID=A0A9P6CKB3_9AGAR|nr:hypothetical protein BDZ94DRAFT_1243233 [Collybia nuda]
MVYGCLGCNNFMSANNSVSTRRVYDERQNREGLPSATPEHQRSFFVTLSARVLGSAGLGLSILAIWLRWFVPPSAVLPESKPNKPQIRLRRRSTLSPNVSPIVLPPIPRTTPPLLPSVLKVSQEPSSNRQRRVYFIDSKLPTIKSQQILASAAQLHAEVKALDQLIVQSAALQSQLEDNPSSSSSSSTNLITNLTSHETFSPSFSAREESIAESDCSSRRSSISIRLPKMNPFLTKGRRGSNTSDVTASSTVMSATVLPLDGSNGTKKSNVGFSAPRSIDRNHSTTIEAPPENSQTKSSSPSRLSFRRLSGSRHPASVVEFVLPLPSSDGTPVTSPSPLTSYFSRKPQRRSSTPVPVRRTSPYEAPYFATPPIPFDTSYSTYLKGLPQFGDDMTPKIARAQTSESEPSRGRGPRPTNNEAQAALGLGRPRLLPKRRSASEGWADDRSPRV